MGKLERLLDILKDEPRDVNDLARRLGVSREELEGMLKILEAMGYVEEVKAFSSCNSCPLRSICGGGCARTGARAFMLKKVK
ncbi:DprA-like winged helix domain-containing protein [Pyrococcus yayanosii]|uniref:LexA-related DNA-binding protein n=1 Tax=Pyrococcus yayanosii (strain CH1 / JCM 16557) TaxID=529709 RepID=F8AEA5_PYRYC|nr:FeoC-like transcriptional regulator [Pyrococcus yayanosii]AEH24616.1 LexA-related DNA-binding protein [Pyrococcus yayanosii CH1]